MIYFIMILIAIALLPGFSREIRQAMSYEYQKKTFKLKILKSDLKSFCAFCIVFFVSAFRYGIGTDYFYTYVPGYIILRDRRYIYDYYEPGFLWLNKLCIAISDNYQVLFIVTSLVIYGLLFWIICKFSVNPKIGFFVYFCSSMYFNSLSNIRQAIAMVICLVALGLYLDWYKTKWKRKIFVFYSLVFVAFLFHSSAIVFILIPFIGLLKNINLKNHIIIAGGLATLAIVANYLGVISNMLNLILKFLDKYQRYNPTGKIYWSFLTFNIAIYIIMYVAIKISSTKNVDDYKGKFFINIQFIAVVVLLFSNVIPWTDRVCRYFMICQCFSVPYFISQIKNIFSRRTIIIAFGSLYIVWIIFYMFSYGADGCFPYQSIFSITTPWQKGYFGY